VNWGLAGAFAATVTYGTGTVLQAVGARQGDSTDELDTRLIRRLLRSTPFIVGMALDGAGFGLSFWALHTLPLFTVQAVIASSLAVTALLGGVVLQLAPSRFEWGALLVVTAGLTLLAVSAKDEPPKVLDNTGRWLLVIAVGVIGFLAYGAAQRRKTTTPGDTWALGALAGLMFGGAGIGARILRTPHDWWRILFDPAAYAIVVSGLMGLLLYAMAMQRGSVTVATAMVVVAETLVPAAVGITLLGDRPAHGRTLLAALGFGMTVLGAVALARYGEPTGRNGETAGESSVGTLQAP
jgi:drug/metabolite transporter (DMT)-like permease